MRVRTRTSPDTRFVFMTASVQTAQPRWERAGGSEPVPAKEGGEAGRTLRGPLPSTPLRADADHATAGRWAAVAPGAAAIPVRPVPSVLSPLHRSGYPRLSSSHPRRGGLSSGRAERRPRPHTDQHTSSTLLPPSEGRGWMSEPAPRARGRAGRAGHLRARGAVRRRGRLPLVCHRRSLRGSASLRRHFAPLRVVGPGVTVRRLGGVGISSVPALGGWSHSHYCAASRTHSGTGWTGTCFTNQLGESLPVPLPRLRLDIPPALPWRSVGRGTLCKQLCPSDLVKVA
ncbi:uncharacterized protein [Heliangelus exortis]|uniref:uncharacterized protein n=1 Tax=Heliangelus exortis TaxID=472823 RepID=UPI003A8F03FF